MHPSLGGLLICIVLVCLREVGYCKEKVMGLQSHVGSERPLLCDFGPLSTFVS